MATNEKGLNRGGAGGQEGELGEERKNPESKQTERNPVDRRGQPRESPERRTGQSGGGLRREPDLQGAERQTGHEVD